MKTVVEYILVLSFSLFITAPQLHKRIRRADVAVRARASYIYVAPVPRDGRTDAVKHE